jgi:sortase (surface protein transpeptidase)
MKKINDLSLNMKAVKIGDEIAITDLKKKVKYYEKEIA